MAERPVIVVGAGLAGLACATRLRRSGIPVRVFEASNTVGGRVHTDRVDGYLLDRGFQVLNTAYPALAAQVSLDALELRELPRGIRIRKGGRVREVQHPLTSPAAGPRALFSGVTSVRGKLALARYAAGLVTSGVDGILARPDVSTREAWEAQFPRELVDDVMRPFIAGVLLEDRLDTSRVFTDLVARTFARGRSAVPAQGMRILPQTMAAALDPHDVEMERPVAEVHPHHVTTRDGVAHPARAVVVATDPWTAHRLLPELGKPPAARGVTTHYFSAAPWRGASGTLTVDADGSGVLNSVILSLSAPDYAPRGRLLISTSVLHDGVRPALGVDEAEAVARRLHEAPDRAWEYVASRDVPQALPAMTAPHPMRSSILSHGVWVAGDHRDTSSIQGALVSGRRVADAVARVAAQREAA